MAWDDFLSDRLSDLIVTIQQAAIVGGGIAAVAGLALGELPLILSGSLIAVSAVTAAAAFAKSDDPEEMPPPLDFSATDWDSAPQPVIEREAGPGRYQELVSRQKKQAACRRIR